MPNSRSRNRDEAAVAPRRQPRTDGADAGFQLGTGPRLPADAGFFLDIDGTLLDIAERPQLVRIDDDLGHLLATIRDASGGALALISGRSVAEIDRLFGGISAPPDSTERNAAMPPEKCTSTASRLQDFARR